MKPGKPALILAASAALNGFCAEINSATANVPAAAANVTSHALAILPGNGLAQHMFVYTGEYDIRNADQTIFIVRDGGPTVFRSRPRMARCRSLATPRCYPTETSFSAAR